MEEAVPSTCPPGPASADQDLTGRTVGDFHLLRRIGQGGMGQVYLAEQLSLKRNVALKIMRPDLASNGVALKRFQLEAEAVARLTHANIVQVYQSGMADGLHYMALEFVDGKNLREYIAKKGPPELAVALHIMRQVAAGLQCAGEQGIVHRDIKPENILLTRKAEAKVADFGLSRAFGDPQAANLTQSGVAMGTPLYMSPEQVQGKETDPRTDIYSFGVTCYHLLTGQPPFRGASAIEVAIQHVQSDAVPLQHVRPDLPVELCQVVHKMMARDPAARYQTAKELIEELRRLRGGLSGTQGITTMPGPGSSVRLGPPTDTASRHTTVPVALPVGRRANGRRLRFVGMVFFTLLLALGGGAALRLWRESQRPAAPAPEEPSPLDNVREPAGPRPQEVALLEALNKPPASRTDEERRRYPDQVLQLAALYIDQRRLDEADAVFRTYLEKNHFACKVGAAIVLAFRDEAAKSLEQFNRLEMNKLEQFAKSARHRRLLSEALNHNAANLGTSLPESLERLRKPAASPKGAEK